MPKTKNIFTIGEIASCISMLLALLWLTVSLPFVNYSLQIAEENSVHFGIEKSSGQENIPGPVEEKTESGSNSLSEYLHDLFPELRNALMVNEGFKHLPDPVYLAYHPDLVLLPPEA